MRIQPEVAVTSDCYLSYCLLRNPSARVATSASRVTGVLALSHSQNAAVAKAATQELLLIAESSTFEFWLPGRRPGGKNLAIRETPPIRLFHANEFGEWRRTPDDAAQCLGSSGRRSKTARDILLGRTKPYPSRSRSRSIQITIIRSNRS